MEKGDKEYKSILKIKSGDKGFRDLSVSCVALANAQGGEIFIGFDDKSCKPLPNQIVSVSEINDTVSRLRSLCFNVSLTSSDVLVHENGGQYFIITILPSTTSIASTSDGKFYIRIGDKCEPVRSEDIQHLAAEKSSFQWELICKNDAFLNETNKKLLHNFAEKIRQSSRVSNHIKQMTDIEIADNYNLINGEYLTYLGVLWIGNAKQRSQITHPITVQYIVYDNLDRKVRKIDWHDNLQNPAEILVDIEEKAIELSYSFEFPDGLFRKQVRHYHPKVVRELLVNAFAHKSYTISGDIMICVYPSRLEISNPGGLPLGVTKDNILHQSQRRNPYMIRIMHDLGLMEGEGSGYDLIYELNALDSKKNPTIHSEYNRTTVIQSAEIINKETLMLFDFVNQNYQLSQKNIIALGFVAQHQKILSTELTQLLQLQDGDRMRNYTDKLVDLGIIITRGVKKGNSFLINPQVINNAKLNQKTSLKTIEPHSLQALIKEDLRLHPNSKMKEIIQRLPDVDEKDVKKFIYKMVDDKEIIPIDKKKNRNYSLRT